MSLVLRCDTCGALSDPVTIYARSEGCQCCSEPDAYVNEPSGWAHSHDGEWSNCAACCEKRQAERDALVRAEWTAYEERIRDVMKRVQPGQTYYTPEEAVAMALKERERARDEAKGSD
jgi:hypothetical protein